MSLQDKVTDLLVSAIENYQLAGGSVLVLRHGEEVLYTQAGMAHIEQRRPVQRDSIFRLYSQSKPVTAAAAMILMERGCLDLDTPVSQYLPAFARPQVIQPDGTLVPARRTATVYDLLGMTSGLVYPDDTPAGQCARKVFDEQEKLILQGGGLSTVDFCSRLGQQPLAFSPGDSWYYGTSADVLGAVIEVVSGMPFEEFLKKEIFEPLEMEDTAFWVPEEKWDRFVEAYVTDGKSFTPWIPPCYAVGIYDRPPAFASGGAGLVSTLKDYTAFSQMLLNHGSWEGRRILRPATVRYMTTPQLNHNQLDVFDERRTGYSYGKLMRVCIDPGQVVNLASPGEYGWNGWLGTKFLNLPEERMTILMMQNITGRVNTNILFRKVCNVIYSHLL